MKNNDLSEIGEAERPTAHGRYPAMCCRFQKFMKQVISERDMIVHGNWIRGRF